MSKFEMVDIPDRNGKTNTINMVKVPGKEGLGKDFKKYLGYKFYKVDEDDHVDIKRIIRIYDDMNTVMVLNENGTKDKMSATKLAKDYTPLQPKGFIMVSHVLAYSSDKEECHDIIVTLYDYIHVKMGDNMPAAICRQSINDFFYNIITEKIDHEFVGVSVSMDNCPANIDYMSILACDDVVESTMVNFYLDDTLEDIIESFNTTPYDKVLNSLYEQHMMFANPLYSSKYDKREEDKGWCRTLHTLLKINNFINDVDAMRNVTSVSFELKEFLNDTDTEDVYEFNPILLDWFNYIYKVNAVKTMVIAYDYDINLGEFNNSNYIFIRDGKNITWIVVYVAQGQYVEKDLEEEFTKLGVADKLRLSFYDKFHSEQIKNQ